MNNNINIINSDTNYFFLVQKEEESLRLDSFIASKFPAYSRNFFKHLVLNNYVKVNTKIITKVSVKVKEGDSIEITFPVQKKIDTSKLISDTLTVSVVYTHEHFLIIDKPAGLLVHPPAHAIEEATLVDWLLHYHNELSAIGATGRPGIIHRLDKNTSGLLIIARTNYAHNVFGKLFHDRHIHKIYHAVVTGHPDKTGTINFPIGRDPYNRTKMKAFNPREELLFANSGIKMRPSQSHYKVLEYYKETSLVEIKPVTGRTHQIRVHLSAIGHPLVGDFVYTQESKLITRHALHAYGISFVFEGKEFTFFSKPPKDFAELTTFF